MSHSVSEGGPRGSPPKEPAHIIDLFQEEEPAATHATYVFQRNKSSSDHLQRMTTALDNPVDLDDSRRDDFLAAMKAVLENNTDK